MKRIQYRQYGGPEQMRLEEFELDAPASGQVRVRVRAAAVNPVDWKIRRGDLKIMTGSRFPRAMGNDFAGTVESVGARVSDFKAGDAVFGVVSVKASGAFAEELITGSRLIAHKPATLSFEEAACLPTAGAAALIGLTEKAKLTRDQALFINGCMGSVGRFATQIARSQGARVSGSCSRADLEPARASGVEMAVDYKALDWSKLAGRFDIVFDAAGTLTIPQAKSLLRPGGRYLDLSGSMSKMVRGMFTRGYQMVMASHTSARLAQLAELAVGGTIKASIGRVAPLSDAIAAISELETEGFPKGKLVVLLGVTKN